MGDSQQLRVSRAVPGTTIGRRDGPDGQWVPPVVQSGHCGPQRNGRLRAAIGTAALWLGLGAALSSPSPAGAADPKQHTAHTTAGLAVSAQGRRRVRGGRADGASIHDAWIAAASGHDHGSRDALAAFERASFSATEGIVDVAPKPWMADLAPPTLPLRWTRRLVEYLTYFKDNPKGRGLMRGWLRRAPRYEATLRKLLADEGVPEDLVFVALAESGFNPTVRSRVGAAGLWQFMEATGKVYGLTQDYWIDERFDVVKSTRAAALYLKDLHTRFGTWELALAAFNAGYGLVMVSIDRHNTNDFWTLADLESGLPFATTNYVPKIIAAAVVGRNRAAFGFEAADLDPLPAIDWIEVRVPGKTSLKSLAKKLGESTALIAEINGRYVRGRTPPRGASTVRIPRSAKAAFVKAYPALADEAAALQQATLRHGERLGALAKRYGTTVKALRRANGVRDAAELTGGTVLVIPPPPDSAEPAKAEDPPPPVLAAVPELSAVPGQRRVFFRTNRASLPRDLTRAFETPWSKIVQWNALDPRARLQSGQVLQLLVDDAFDAADRQVALLEGDDVTVVVRGSREHIEEGLARRGLQRRAYRAKKGDTLAKIGRRFDLTIGDLARINAFPRSHDPTAGELIVVYVSKSKRGATLRAPDPPTLDRRKPSTAGTAGTPTRADDPAPASTAPARKPSTADTAGVPGRRRAP